MTQEKVKEVNKLMFQMDLDLQEYALDMLRHLKAAQTILNTNKRNPPNTNNKKAG